MPPNNPNPINNTIPAIEIILKLIRNIYNSPMEDGKKLTRNPFINFLLPVPLLTIPDLHKIARLVAIMPTTIRSILS